MTFVGFIVASVIYITARPTRDEVDKMIDVKVNSRFDALEKSIAEIRSDVKLLLRKRK